MDKKPFHKTVEYNSFYEMLIAHNSKIPDKPAIRFLNKKEPVTITYGEMTEQIAKIWRFYNICGIKKYNIGIVSENRYEYITIYLASVFDNAIVPVDKEITREALRNVLNKFDIKVLYYTNRTEKVVYEAAEGFDICLINIDSEYCSLIRGKFSADIFLQRVSTTDKDRCAVIALTSGTTGEYKGVMLSQYNILSNLRAAVENNILKSPSLSILPMNHTYGFNPGVLNTFYNGNTLCINMELKNIVRDLKYYNPYFIGVVPMVAEGMYKNIIREAKRTKKYDMLMKMIKISNFLRKFKIDLRHVFFGNILNKRLRVIVSGGAALNPYYVERFEELGISLLNGYGLTECSPLVAVNRKVHNVPGSVGRIIKDDDVQIADDGEIMVKGPNVMLGYYNDHEATAQCMKDGYYLTGDYGYKDGNILYVTGRKKNLIILENGKNFSPEPIENKLMELSYIKECLIVSRKIKENSIIRALIYLEEQADQTVIEDDIDSINKLFPSYMKIDDYEIMTEEFEKTSTKKIIRSKYVK